MQKTSHPQEAHGPLLRNAALVGGAALFSRLLGFARDMSMAWLLGGGLVADALVLALRLPNVLRRLLGEGALSMSLTADLVRTAAPGSVPRLADMAPLASAVGRRLACILGCAVLLGLCFTRPLAMLLAPGQAHDAALMDQALPLLRLTLPYALFAGLAALGMATLNAVGRFLLPALLPAFFNCTVLLFALAAALELAPAAWLLALGTLCGGLVQWLVQAVALRRLMPVPTDKAPQAVSVPPPSGAPLDPIAFADAANTDPRLTARRSLARLPMSVMGSCAPQLSMLGAMVAASWLPGGGMAALYYAERLMELPLGVAGAALGIASLPALASLAANAQHQAFNATATKALRLSLCVTLPATAGLLAVAEPLVQVLFARGAFDHTAVAATTAALMGYAPGLPAYGLTRPLLAACHALGHTRLTAISGVGSVLLALTSSLFLTLLLPPAYALLGPPLGVSAGLWGQATFLALALRQRCPGMSFAPHVKSLAQHLTAALGTGLVAYGLSLVPLSPLGGLALAVAGGMVACACLLALMRNAEFAEIRQHFCRKGHA